MNAVLVLKEFSIKIYVSFGCGVFCVVTHKLAYCDRYTDIA